MFNQLHQTALPVRTTPARAFINAKIGHTRHGGRSAFSQLSPKHGSNVRTDTASTKVIRTIAKKQRWSTHHLTNSSLQDGIKPALRSIPVTGHHLLLHLLVETVHFICQREDVTEPEGGDAVRKEFVSVGRRQRGQGERRPLEVTSGPHSAQREGQKHTFTEMKLWQHKSLT